MTPAPSMAFQLDTSGAPQCPRIIVYAAADGDGPDSMKYAAAMVPRIVPKKGKVPAHAEAGTSWLATGATPEEARGKLEAMWVRPSPRPSYGARSPMASRSRWVGLWRALCGRPSPRLNPRRRQPQRREPPPHRSNGTNPGMNPQTIKGDNP